MDEKTQERYETGKNEGYISAMDAFHRGYETEEIFHEEDPLRVLRRLESEGWTKHLAPALSSAKANVPELERLRGIQTQLQLQGIHPEGSVANFPLLTAKVSPADVAALKKSFPRQGFVAEIEALEAEAKEFATQFSGKGASAPSQAWKLLYSAKPEAILWTAHTSKNAGVQAKFKSFYTEWPQARQKLPYTLMQEMRIIPSLPEYDELLEKLFFELMDSNLGTVEEMKAYLEPYSPPAPPPPVHMRRARVAKKDAKPAKSRKKAVAIEAGEENGAAAEVATETTAVAAPTLTNAVAVKAAAPAKTKDAKTAAPVKAAAKKSAPPMKAAAKKAVAPVKKSAPIKKVVAKSLPKKAVAKKPTPPVKKAAAKKVTQKAVAKKAPAKAPAKTTPLKAPAKSGAKGASKSSAKKPAPAKGKKKR